LHAVHIVDMPRVPAPASHVEAGVRRAVVWGFPALPGWLHSMQLDERQGACEIASGTWPRWTPPVFPPYHKRVKRTPELRLRSAHVSRSTNLAPFIFTSTNKGPFEIRL
jgi:hypothetical protein